MSLGVWTGFSFLKVMSFRVPTKRGTTLPDELIGFSRTLLHGVSGFMIHQRCCSKCQGFIITFNGYNSSSVVRK